MKEMEKLKPNEDYETKMLKTFDNLLQYLG